MELKIYEGDYLPDGLGCMERVSGTEELLQRAFLKLSARRGSFPLLPEFGSNLYQLGRVKPSQRQSAALSWAVEALSDEPELSVTGVELRYLSADRLLLGVQLSTEQGTAYSLELEVDQG